MADKLSHASLLQILEWKMDHLTARNVVAVALRESELGEKPEYEKAELDRLLPVLKAEYGGNMEKVEKGIVEFFNPPPEPAPVVLPPVVEVVAPPPPPEPAPPVAEAEVPADAPPAEKVDEAKPDAAAEAEAKDDKAEKKKKGK